MKKIISLYKQLIFLKISPEVLPYSRSLLWGLILSYFLINVAVLLSLEVFPAWQVIVANAATIFLSIVFLYGLLKSKKMQVRLHKILLALFGVDLFFLILSLLIQPLDLNFQLMTAFILMLWSLSIKTHIFSTGLNLKKITAIFTVINFEVIRHLPVALLVWSSLPPPS